MCRASPILISPQTKTMVRILTAVHGMGIRTSCFESVPVAIGLFVSVSALVALCAKQAKRRISNNKYSGDRDSISSTGSSSSSINSSKIAPRSPVVASSKQLFTTISNKAMIPFKSKKKLDETSGFNECVLKDMGLDDGEEGLWQRSILMGEKCQPPEFSGVIYYDSNGKQLPELPPKSPRAASLPIFAFPTTQAN